MKLPRAVASVLALAGSNGFRLAVQLALLPLLARLLGPEAYGLVALAMPFVLATSLVADAGLGAALVREQAPSRATESTIFWLTLLVGLGLAGLLAALTGVIAALAREPALTPLILACTPTIVLSAAVTVPNARLHRERRFGAFAYGDLASTLAGAGVAVWGAYAGWGAWALIAQQLALWTVKFLMVSWQARFTPALTLDLSLCASHVRFGMHQLGGRLAEFVARNLDNVIVGRALGVGSLGIYSMAYQVVRFPEMLVAGPVFMVVFPTVAAASNDRAQVARLYATAIKTVALAVAPLSTGLILTADLAVDVVLGAKWSAVATPLALLAPLSLILCLMAITSAALLGVGRAKLQMHNALALAAATLVGVVGGAPFGVNGVAAGLLICSVIVAGPLLARSALAVGVSLPRLLACLRQALGASVVMAVAVLAIRQIPAPAPVLLGLSVAVGAAVYSGSVFLTGWRELARELRDFGSDRSRRAV